MDHRGRRDREWSHSPTRQRPPLAAPPPVTAPQPGKPSPASFASTLGAVAAHEATHRPQAVGSATPGGPSEIAMRRQTHVARSSLVREEPPSAAERRLMARAHAGRTASPTPTKPRQGRPRGSSSPPRRRPQAHNQVLSLLEECKTLRSGSPSSPQAAASPLVHHQPHSPSHTDAASPTSTSPTQGLVDTAGDTQRWAPSTLPAPFGAPAPGGGVSMTGMPPGAGRPRRKPPPPSGPPPSYQRVARPEVAGRRRASDAIAAFEADEKAAKATHADAYTPRSVRSTATGYGAGDEMPRARGLQGATTQEDKLVRLGKTVPERRRPGSAPPLREDAPAVFPLDGIPPNKILYELFLRHGFRVPYHYFYEPFSFDVVPTFDLTVWKDFGVDDAFLTVLGACTGHTAVVHHLRLTGCTSVTDVGACVLVPRLPKLKVLDAEGLPFVTDKLIFAITTSVPADGSHDAALAGKLAGAGGDATGPDGTVVDEAVAPTLVETAARVYGGGGAGGGTTTNARLALPCPRLLTVNLSGCHRVSDAGLLALCRSYTRITSLDVSGSSISDRGLRELLVYCRSLRRLHLARTAVTDAAFDQLPVLARLVPVNPLAQRADVLASRAPPAAVARLKAPKGRGTRPDPVSGKEDLYLVLEDVDVSGCHKLSADGLRTLLSVTPHLTKLDVSRGPRVTDDVLEALWNRGVFYGNARSAGSGGLQWLSLAGCRHVTSMGVSHLTIRNTGITHLDLSACPGIDLRAIRHLNSLPAVKTLCLADNPTWHPDSLKWLFGAALPNTTDPRPQASQLTTITSLDLTNSTQLGAEDASLRMLAALPGLESLTWPQLALDGDNMRALVESVPNARRLDLRHATGITEQGAMYLMGFLPALEWLNVAGCRGVTDRLFTRLETGLSPSLRHLCVAGLPDGGGTGKLTDAGMGKFSNAKHKRLAALDVSHHPALTHLALGSMCGHMTTLHTLRVTGCPNVTDAAVRQLADDRKDKWPYVEAVTRGQAPGDGFTGVRLVVDLEGAKVRDGMAAALRKQHAAVGTIASWLRHIWDRRRRWTRNASKALSVRAAALTIQRVARGFGGRVAARNLRGQCLRVARHVDREWPLLQRRRRENMSFRRRVWIGKARAWRWFTTGCREWIRLRGPPLSEEDVNRAVLQFLFTTKRKAFEVLKAAVAARRKQWDDTVAWHAYICKPRYFAKLRRLTDQGLAHRQRMAREVFQAVADIGAHNSERQAARREAAALFNLRSQTRLPFAAWSKRFMEESAAELHKLRRRILLPFVRSGIRQWHAWADKRVDLRDRLAAWQAKAPRKVLRRTFAVVKEEAYRNLEERLFREAEARKAKEEAEAREAEKQRRIEAFVLTRSYRKPFEAWIGVMNYWIRKRVRWAAAKKYSKGVEKRQAWRYLVAGVAATKARRFQKTLAMRKAVEFMVDNRLVDLRYRMAVWQEWAHDNRQERLRRQRILRAALARWMNSLMVKCYNSWIEFVGRRQAFVAFVVRVQTLWRRRGPMKYLAWIKEKQFKQPAAALVLQNWWRGRKQRYVINQFMRMKRLIQYKRREYEWDLMRANDRLGYGMREVWHAAIFLQRFWRNRVKLRAVYRELRKHMQRERDSAAMKAKENHRWELDNKRMETERAKKAASAVLVMQAMARRFIARCRWGVHTEAKRRHIGAIMWQKAWKGELARRHAAALRRLKASREWHHERRRRVGLVMRALGFSHRYQQQQFMADLAPLGLHPDEFTMLMDRREENLVDKEFMAEELTHLADMTLRNPLDRIQRQRQHSRWFRESQLARLPRQHDAVRIINPEAAAVGETGQILKLELSYGRPRVSVRLDSTQKMAYLPLITVPTVDKRSEATAALVPKRRFRGVPTKLGDKWRSDIEEWAARERDERRRYLAAAAIQRCARNHMAPIFMARQKIQEDTIIHNRRARLGAALKVLRSNNQSVGDWVVRLGVVRRVDLPTDLVQGPVHRSLRNFLKRRHRVQDRTEEVFREIRRRREFVKKMDRLEWSKMSRWQRRLNWNMAPAVRARRGLTERARVFLRDRWEEVKILASLDRTMMFEGSREFRSRTRRMVGATVHGGQRYGPLKDIGVRQATLRDYNFRSLRRSRHVDGYAAAQRVELKARKRRIEKQRAEEAAGKLGAIKNAGIGGFRKYLNKLDNIVSDKKTPVAGSSSSGDDGPVATTQRVNGRRVPRRQGGQGLCEVFGTWDGPRPHGTGKAKFIMTVGYDAALDMWAGDMYDELLCNFDYGTILGDVTIRYHDGSVYEGPYVPDGEPRGPQHVGRRTSPGGVVMTGPVIDNHTVPHAITGHATVTLPGGESYDGDWVNGKRHGRGVAVLADGSRFQGSWKADVMHGYGRRWDDKGLLVEGLWVYGVQQVGGRQRLPQRHGGYTVYSGGILSSMWHGTGRCEYNDGSVYEGRLEGGKRQGWGFLHSAGNIKYTGPFEKHAKHGNGAEKMPDGDVYDGPFQNGKRHGVGMVTQLRPRPPQDFTIWEGSQADEGWITDWTGDKPEMRGPGVKKTERETAVIKSKGWQHLKVWDPTVDKETPQEDEEEAARAREAAELARRMAEEEAHLREERKKRRARRDARRERIQAVEKHKTERRAARPTWQDSTTSESGSDSEFSPWSSENDDLPRAFVVSRAAMEATVAESAAAAAELGLDGGDDKGSLADFSVEQASVVSQADAGAAAGGADAVHQQLALSPGMDIVRRRGRWLFGKFLEWLSVDVTKEATSEFCRRFFREGVEFDSLYATLIARRLPRLPDGVDPHDIWVQRALREIIFRAADLLGIDTLREQEKHVAEIEEPLKKVTDHAEALWADVLAKEEEVKIKAEAVAAAQAEFDEAAHTYKESYLKVVEYWRGPAAGAGETYREAVARLQSLIALDWELLVKSWEPGGVASTSRAIRLMCDAINDFFNRHPPSFKQARMLCQSAGDNADMGDREAVYHNYNVLMMHLVENLNPFKLCATDKPERVSRYMAQPDFHVDCADYHAVSDAPAAMMNYLLATQRFVVAAREVEPDRLKVQHLSAFMKTKQSILYLEQEQLSEMRRKVVEAQAEHKAAVRDVSIIMERKEEMEADLAASRTLIQTGRMPAPKPVVLEYAQNRALSVWDNRASLRSSIL